MEAIADKQCAPRARTTDRAHGETLVREVWTHALAPGEVDFPGVRLLLCVRQMHQRDDGTQRVEWRYFVTSLSTVDLSFHRRLVERRSIALPAPPLKWPCSRNR